MRISDAFPHGSRGRNPLRPTVHFLLYWLVKAVVLLFLGLRLLLQPRPVRYGLLALLMAGGIAWKALGTPAFLPWSGSAVQQESVSTAVADPSPPPQIVEDYLRAQARFDAAGMWETMAERFKRRMLTTSNSQEQLQKELDKAREEGRSYSAATYVGGAALDNGKMAYLYILVAHGPNGDTRLPYTFVVDSDGKIGNVQWSIER